MNVYLWHFYVGNFVTDGSDVKILSKFHRHWIVYATYKPRPVKHWDHTTMNLGMFWSLLEFSQPLQ